MSDARAPRTYWHLAELGRVPGAYDIGSSRLLYYPGRGFEVASPIAAAYARHQGGSRLRLSVAAGERFRDPRETTYAGYTELQRHKEIFVDGLFRGLDDGAYDRRLPPAWLDVLGQVLAPLRYPVHGLQMVAGYVGSMAPASRVVIACALQAGDEMRRVQRFAYRMRQLQETHPRFGHDAKIRWQAEPMWQPWRRVLERLLVTYDWGEAFVALALVVKPAFDELFGTRLGRLAAAHGDEALEKLLASLGEDAAWHRAWAEALARTLVEEEPEHGAENAAAIAAWRAAWAGPTHAAVAAFAPLFEEVAS
jgi:toluene monooxygenase system protein E